MITVAIIGILAAIAIPTFSRFMRRSKKVEAHLFADKAIKNVKVFWAETRKLPVTSSTMPLTAACLTGTGKTSQHAQPVWEADPGWKDLQLHLDEPGYFQYTWTSDGLTNGNFTTTGDLGCNLIPYIYTVNATVLAENVVETVVFESEIN